MSKALEARKQKQTKPVGISRFLEFLNAATTNTGQATYYNSDSAQAKKLQELHTGLLEADRRLYTISIAFPINDYNRQAIVTNLLRTGKVTINRSLEDHALLFTSAEMQFNRLLNLADDLREAKINNRRTRNFCQLLWDSCDAYRVIKYRDKIRRMLRHCHIPEGNDPAKAELHRWIFGKIDKANQVVHNPKLKARLEAHKNYELCFELPLDIGQAIAIKSHGKTAEQFAAEYAGKDGKKAKGTVTRKESIRTRKTANTDVDFNRFDIVELLMHLYRKPDDYEAAKDILDNKATTLAKSYSMPPKLAVVVDNSGSMRGSGQREHYPVATTEATCRTLAKIDGTVAAFYYVGPEPRPLLRAEGSSNLRLPLARALAEEPDMVLIISDGYENVSAGSVSQILNTSAVKKSGIVVIHLNPVASAEAKTVRKLSEQSKTLGLTGPAQLPTMLLLEQATNNPDILLPIFDEIEAALINGKFQEAKRISGKLQANLLTQEASDA